MPATDESSARATAPVVAKAPVVFTIEERIDVIHLTASVTEILRTTLKRGVYFEGAAGVHDFVKVHRAALRAAATLMRKVSLCTVLFHPPTSRVRKISAFGVVAELEKADFMGGI